MSGMSAVEEKTPARPTAVAAEVTTTTSPESFRPLLFLLSSLTADTIDAAAVARLLQPHFRNGDFYIINAAAFVTPANTPADAKKGGGTASNNNNNNNASSGAVSLTSTPGSTSESVKAGVQAELTRIAAAREAARRAAAEARAAQLRTLQAEYEEDGLTPADAHAAAVAELRERSDSDDEDGDRSDLNDGRHQSRDGRGSATEGVDHGQQEGNDAGPASSRRLPPCVCVLNVPLTCSAIDRFTRGISGVAAAVLLESRCAVRDVAPHPTATPPAGPTGAGDKAKGRGGGGGGGANAAVSANGRAAVLYTDDVVEYLNGAAALLTDDGCGLPNTLVQRVEYPTEAVGGNSSGNTNVVFRPTVSAAQFVASVHAQLLRIFQCWLRYEAWRQGRACVRVPPYVPARDADAVTAAAAAAGAAAGGVDAKAADDAAMPPPPDRRLSKRKSAGASSAAASDMAAATAAAASAEGMNGTPGACAAAAAAAARPQSMADVAAERFEYGAAMQRWATTVTREEAAMPCAGLHACLAACLEQVRTPHGASVLRSRAEAAAAQLREDVRAASEMCAETHRIGNGEVPARSSASALRDQLDRIRRLALQALFGSHGTSPGGRADTSDLEKAQTVEAAMVQCLASDFVSPEAALSTLHAAIAATSGEGDAAHWLRRALVAREQHGWRVAAHQWRSAPLCTMRWPAESHRTLHTAFVFAGPTTFPQFYRDEDFLEAEGRVYELNSSSSESEAEEEEEEEEDDDEAEAEEENESDSDNSTAAVNAAAPAEAGKAQSTSTSPPVPAAVVPAVDHAAIVSRQLRRRRVFEQIRAGHTRPPLQESSVLSDRCRGVVTETSWMHAVDGSLIEVATTVANSSQVRCTVMADAAGVVQGGFMLECPPHLPSPSSTAAAATTPVANGSAQAATEFSASGPPQPAQSLEATVESGVRGFVQVDDRLRVFTTVVADNSHAVDAAAHALAVSAAKEAAVAQYEAQFNKAAKAAKGREKGSTAAAPLSLEDITAHLLATVPPPQHRSVNGDGATAATSPPLMRVHALFPRHHCVLTAATAAPGVRLDVLPSSAYISPFSTTLKNSTAVAAAVPSSSSQPLLTVFLWWNRQLCTAALRQLAAAHVYVDGVVELLSPDLPPSARIVLHPSGGYVTEASGSRLFVSARGRCTLYAASGDSTNNAATPVGAAGQCVHTLQSGQATAVTNDAVYRTQREDGWQQEFVRTTAHSALEGAAATANGAASDQTTSTKTAASLGRLTKTVFGPGVRVFQSGDERQGGDTAPGWSWRIAGLPLLRCHNGANRSIAAALDEAGVESWVYVPDERSFEVHTRDPAAHVAGCRVAATLSSRSCRLTLWGNRGVTYPPPSEASSSVSAFVVDCAYGGVCGTVQSTHRYRVSPFGRCAEEVLVASSTGPTTTTTAVNSTTAVARSNATASAANGGRWQLVLPPQYKRPKKKEPEVVLMPEYASDAFHCAVSGAEGGKDAVLAADILHLQRDPPFYELEKSDPADAHSQTPTVMKGDDALFFAETFRNVLPTGRKVTQEARCVALHSNKTDGAGATTAVHSVSAVMDAASWAAYAQWLSRLPETELHRTNELLPTESAKTASTTIAAHQPPTLTFDVVQTHFGGDKLHPLTAVDCEAQSAPQPPAQRCVLLHHLLPGEADTPAWCATGALTAAMEACCPIEDQRTNLAANSLARDAQEQKSIQNISEVPGVDPSVHTTPSSSAASPVHVSQQVEAQSAASALAPAPRTDERVLATPLPSAHAALNYWSSPCCPRTPLPREPTAVTSAQRSTGSADKVKEDASCTVVQPFPVKAETDSTGVATAAVSADREAAALSAPSSAASARRKAGKTTQIPLMRSYAAAADAQTGTTASSRFHSPLLKVSPAHIDFGNVPKGRRYVTTFALTNTSTVPCRYRVRLSAALRPYVAVAYPRHFVAPGMTVSVNVELSGWQPHGVVDSELTVAHEGGLTEVGVVWCTTDATHNVKLGRNVVCAGWSVSKPALQHPSKAAVADGEEGEGGLKLANSNSSNDSDSETSVGMRTA